MQRSNVFVGCCQSLLCRGFLSLLVTEGRLQVRKSTLLVCQGLGVFSAFGRRVLHKGLVVTLSIFFSDLSLCHLLVQVLGERVHHRNDAIALFGLLGVSLNRLRRRGRCITAMDTDAYQCRWLVQLGIVEFVQAILCESNQFLCGSIGRHQGSVVFVFLLSLLSCLCNALVQSADAILQCVDLLLSGDNALLALCNCGLQVCDLFLLNLLLVIREVKLFITILFLVIVISLLLLKFR